MEAPEFAAWRESLSLTQEQAAGYLGVTARTIKNLEGGKSPITDGMAYACRYLSAVLGQAPTLPWKCKGPTKQRGGVVADNEFANVSFHLLDVGGISLSPTLRLKKDHPQLGEQDLAIDAARAAANFARINRL